MTTQTAPEIGLRERKKRQTRDRLVAAAFALFAERGFDHVSAAEIAARADVSERTFFRYFATKEDVIFPETEELRGRVDELVANLPTELSVIDGLRRALKTISHEFEDSKDLQLARARLVESTPSLQTLVLQHEQEWVESFANAVADRLGLDPDEDLRPELTAAVVVAAFRAVMNRWIRSGGNADVDQMLDQALVFLGSGLGSSDFD